jgi:hypothetical protein
LRTNSARRVFGTTLAYVGDISAATLTYRADPTVRGTGVPITGLTGNVIGFLGSDTLGNATSGTLGWATDATPASPPGLYAVNGTGLSALNYVLTQAPGNATALTLAVGTPTPPTTPIPPITPITPDTVNTAPRQVIASVNTGLEASQRYVLTAVSRPIASSLFDISNPMAQSCFAPINVAMLNQEALNKMLECRRDFKRKLFAEADYKLEIDPSLADVPPCATAAEAASGQCRITGAQLDEVQASQPKATPAAQAPRAKPAALPQIERKIAVLIGINDYADKKIPRLENAVPDVEAVSKIFAEKLGYEVRVVRNPTKADIFRTLNQLSTEVQSSDSVVVYYAGHGYSLAKNPAGYWLPADAPVSDPTRWISNSDIAKLLAGLRSKQMAVISDSCYSGAFAREGMGSVGRDVTAEDVLTKRSVIVMSSGGDEPVADEGKDGHSVFAYNLMKAIGTVENWRPGSTVFNEVQLGVKKDFPQTPRYGSVTAAGHQQGGDYLFELR